MSHTCIKPGALRTLLGAALAALSLGVAALPAYAQQAAIYAPGDPIITGFPGALPPQNPPPSTDPLDRTMIDLDGNSMVIQHLQPNGPPSGQLMASPPAFAAKARDVGEVFGIALDNAPELTGAAAPNIYLSATSAFGLDIVVPDTDGSAVRSKVGAPDASFMPGQWGAANGAAGSPGSIWRVDGMTGQITQFADIPHVGAAGLGEIVFDASTQQFFVSDLDTGLIYRLDSTGQVLDSFDHGDTARPSHNLAPVADDGSEADIASPDFNSEDPATWGFTQPERKVYGLAVHGGRLYYAVAAGPQIWSVGINLDGSFASDARWELDVTGLPSTNEITNIVFDPQGRMILAQRGPQFGSYDYSIFADPKTSSVVRYTREAPDDPNTPSAWVETPDTYAIGFRPDGQNASGGIALGYGYDAKNQSIGGYCSNYLWSTGDSLRDDPAMNPPLDPPAQVHGLQGNDKELVRPDNDPPVNSYFTDYDGNTGDDQAQFQGHVGDVEIWQKCEGGPSYAGPLPPPNWKLPPGGNLTLYKEPTPVACQSGNGDLFCGFTIRVKNTGKTTYWGPLSVDDWLPDNNPGAHMSFDPVPPWSCTALGSTEYECDYPPVFLNPGDSVDLHETVQVPAKGIDYCYLDNSASIDWRYGFRDANPSDDSDSAAALIRSQDCGKPHGPRTNLKLQKFAHPTQCLQGNGGWDCVFYIKVTNTGPGDYNAPIQVKDTLPFPMSVTTSPTPPWSCSTSGVTVTCDHPSQLLHPGQFELLRLDAAVPYALVRDKKICRIDNVAQITKAPGGTDLNVDPSDDKDGATATIPSADCNPDNKTDLSLTKTGVECRELLRRLGDTSPPSFACSYTITIKNQGPGSFSGVIHFADHFSQPLASISTSSGLTCTPVGPGYDCASTGSVSLAPNATISYTVSGVVASGNGEICRLGNVAKLTSPAGGTAMNTNPNNDSGQATLPIPDRNCDHTGGGNDLSLRKTAVDCPPAALLVAGSAEACFDVTIKNEGPGAFNGPLHFSDQFGTAPSTLHTDPGIACSLSGSSYDCGSTGNVSLAANASKTYHLFAVVNTKDGTICAVRNIARITTPVGGSATNTNPGNDFGMAVVTFDNRNCGTPTGGTPTLRIIKRPGTCSTDGGMDYCTFTVAVSNAGTAPTSGPVTAKDTPAGGLAQAQNGNGCTVNGDSCTSNGPLAAGGSFSFRVLVKVGDRAAYDNQCQVPNTASIVVPVNGGSASATDTVTTGLCGPRILEPIDNTPPRQCGANAIGTYPDCACPTGYHHDTRTSCVPDRPIPTRQCGANAIGTYPDCACPTGYHHDTRTSCVQDPPDTTKQCGPNTTGTYPRCACLPNYHHDTRTSCVPDVAGGGNNGDNGPKCGANMTGTYPRCVCLPGFKRNGKNSCGPDLSNDGNGNNGNNGGDHGIKCGPNMTGAFPRCICLDGYHRDGRNSCTKDTLSIAPLGDGEGKKPIRINPGVIKTLQCPAHSSGQFPDCSCDRGYHHPDGSNACVPFALEVNPNVLRNLNRGGFSRGGDAMQMNLR